jgi:hypothetical protein
LDRSADVGPYRPIVIGPVVAVKVPVVGLYSSALARLQPLPQNPPAIKTWPLGRSVAVAAARGVVIEPVALNVPVMGLYSSALARTTTPEGSTPPATKTWPLVRSVAVEASRAVVMEPVALKVPVWALAVRGQRRSARDEKTVTTSTRKDVENSSCLIMLSLAKGL